MGFPPVVDWSMHDATLRTLWTEGLTATQIAARIPGATRCGILGKLKRIGLKRGAVAAKPKPCAPKAERRQPFVLKPPVAKPRVEKPRVAPRPAPTTPFVAPAGHGTALLDLPPLGSCRWPYNDADGFARMACAAATGSDDPRVVYCPAHRTMAYVPRVPKNAERGRR